MDNLPPWLTVALLGSVFGSIGGVSAWLLNIYNLRKTKREITRIEKELERTDRRIITPDDPNWERISREAHQAFRTVKKIGAISTLLPAFIAAGLVCSLMLWGVLSESHSLGAALSDTRRDAKEYAFELQALLRQCLIDLTERFERLREHSDTSDEELQQMIADTGRQISLAKEMVIWHGSMNIEEARMCRDQIQRASVLLRALERRVDLSK